MEPIRVGQDKTGKKVVEKKGKGKGKAPLDRVESNLDTGKPSHLWSHRSTSDDTSDGQGHTTIYGSQPQGGIRSTRESHFTHAMQDRGHDTRLRDCEDMIAYRR